IEARSCERFARLAPKLPPKLGKFYAGLLAAEARHFEHYIEFARAESGDDEGAVDLRLEELKTLEADLVTKPDMQFRFHSGPPA
ncbi:MAG: tRNA-(ms[2]io[6]A)-hydroxylase, partial [Woeseiaceae bacterium]|nr:tRNA-(ms[2]io[6]A)-hydroxylase [Woeseiaceae bacterium]